MNGDLRTAGIVGLGFMGGSIARGLKAVDPSVRVLAVDPDDEVRIRARADGVADEVFSVPSPALGSCDLVLLCAPIAAIEGLLGPVSRFMADGAVLTDVGGAKERVIERARGDVRPAVRFVGGHPMFGGQPGYAASRGDRWKGGTVALCSDGGDLAALDWVTRFHERLGAKVIRCSAAEHDAAVALVSHLPHLLAGALSLSVHQAGPLAAALAGPDLRDMTRLAQFTFDAHGELSRRNRHLPAAAEQLQGELRRLLAEVTASPDQAWRALQAARNARGELL